MNGKPVNIWLQAAQRIDHQTAACCAISDECFGQFNGQGYEWHATYTKHAREFAAWFKPGGFSMGEYWWPTSYGTLSEEQQNIRVIALLLMHHITENQG